MSAQELSAAELAEVQRFGIHTPAEELEAAIDKLTLLKVTSTREPWSRSEELWDSAGRWEVVSPGGMVSSDGDGIGAFGNQSDADLIVTLHRTVHAQIDLLRSARAFYGAGITGPDTATVFAEHALRLARTVNGVSL